MKTQKISSAYPESISLAYPYDEKKKKGKQEKKNVTLTILIHVKPCVIVAAAAKSLQSCPTLCDPIDGSPPGSPIPGILQARTLEWVAISFSNA